MQDCAEEVVGEGRGEAGGHPGVDEGGKAVLTRLLACRVG